MFSSRPRNFDYRTTIPTPMDHVRYVAALSVRETTAWDPASCQRVADALLLRLGLECVGYLGKEGFDGCGALAGEAMFRFTRISVGPPKKESWHHEHCDCEHCDVEDHLDDYLQLAKELDDQT